MITYLLCPFCFCETEACCMSTKMATKYALIKFFLKQKPYNILKQQFKKKYIITYALRNVNSMVIH